MTNPRKLRIWNSLVLYEHMALVDQFVAQIQEMSNEEGLPISQLPSSVTPTLMLFNICQCYKAMYNKLVEEDLIKENSPKAVITIQ